MWLNQCMVNNSFSQKHIPLFLPHLSWNVLTVVHHSHHFLRWIIWLSTWSTFASYILFARHLLTECAEQAHLPFNSLVWDLLPRWLWTADWYFGGLAPRHKWTVPRVDVKVGVQSASIKRETIKILLCLSHNQDPAMSFTNSRWVVEQITNSCSNWLQLNVKPDQVVSWNAWFQE